MLVPLLTTLYVWDVDVYEDEPLRILALTIGAGFASEVAVGLLARSVAPLGVVALSESGTRRLLTRGLGLPLLSLAAMIAAARAASIPAVQRHARRRHVRRRVGRIVRRSPSARRVGRHLPCRAPARGARVPAHRLSPRALIALPVIAAGAVGSAAGAVWLRYRAPANDRRALGPLGSPLIAITVAYALVAGAQLIAEYVRTHIVSLVALSLVAALGLIWLRQVIHIGLVQEAAELPIGPDITCANCGESTPSHTFCGNCGVALKALPKRR